MKDTILNYLRKKLFASEYARLELAKRTVTGKKVDQQIQLLTRTNLATFDSRILDKSDDILAVVIEEDEADTEFLKQLVDISKNESFYRLMDWLVREQVTYIAKEAVSIDTLNFARGSVNGLSILREEIDRLVGVYQQRVSRPENFDESEII